MSEVEATEVGLESGSAEGTPETVEREEVRRFVREEELYNVWETDLYCGEDQEKIVHTWCENKEGIFIGNLKDAKFLCEKKGIAPIASKTGDKVCSIGWSEKEQKWFGWSHRGIAGFGIGSELLEGSSATTTGYVAWYNQENPQACRRLPVGFKAETLYQAKLMAIAFADSVN